MAKKVIKKSAKKSKASSKSLFQRTTPLDIWKANKLAITAGLLVVAVGFGAYGYVNNYFSSASQSWSWTNLPSISSVPVLKDPNNGSTAGLTAKACLWKDEVAATETYNLRVEFRTTNSRAQALTQEYKPFVASGPVEEIRNINDTYERYRGVKAVFSKAPYWTQVSDSEWVSRTAINKVRLTYSTVGFNRTNTTEPYVVFGLTPALGAVLPVAQSTPVKLFDLSRCIESPFSNSSTSSTTSNQSTGSTTGTQSSTSSAGDTQGKSTTTTTKSGSSQAAPKTNGTAPTPTTESQAPKTNGTGGGGSL